jgi:predicted HTH transcriptional regulator
MTKDELRRLIETQGVERKKSLSERREGLKSLNAMVNADSATGLVLFGVAPDGVVAGIEPGDHDKAQRSLAQHIRQKFAPSVSFEIDALDCEGKCVLAVRGRREATTPLCEYDGKAFIREGSINRQLDLSEKLAIIRRRDRDQHPGPWRCDRCGSWVGQFQSVVFDGKSLRRTYECDCGGQFWPAT